MSGGKPWLVTVGSFDVTNPGILLRGRVYHRAVNAFAGGAVNCRGPRSGEFRGGNWMTSGASFSRSEVSPRSGLDPSSSQP